MIAGVSTKGVEYAAGGGHVGVMALTALRSAQSDGAEVIVPVRPAQQIFANFRHIQLQPDFRLEEGVPLYKLRILDSLIDHLSRTDTATAAEAPTEDRASLGAGAWRKGVGAVGIDHAIASLHEWLRNGSPGGAVWRAGSLPAPGAFVDLVA